MLPKVWAVTGKRKWFWQVCVDISKVEQDCLRLYMGSSDYVRKKRVCNSQHKCDIHTWMGQEEKRSLGWNGYKGIDKLSCGFSGTGGTTESFCLKAFVVAILSRPIQIMLLLSLNIITTQSQICPIFVFFLFFFIFLGFFCLSQSCWLFLVGCLKHVCPCISNRIWAHF